MAYSLLAMWGSDKTIYPKYRLKNVENMRFKLQPSMFKMCLPRCQAGGAREKLGNICGGKLTMVLELVLEYYMSKS